MTDSNGWRSPEEPLPEQTALEAIFSGCHRPAQLRLVDGEWLVEPWPPGWSPRGDGPKAPLLAWRRAV